MKKKLLITLGCSMTEGQGCYDPCKPANINKVLSESETNNLNQDYFNNLEKNKKSFHKNSWPNLVGKKLGFDKVINLGMSGTSNSHHVKKFYEWYENKDLSEYEVLVIWMMTEPFRFSFYIDGKLKSYINDYPYNNELTKSYLNEIKDIELDTVLEQKFYVNSIINFCKLNNVDILLTSWHETFPLLKQILPIDNYIDKTPIRMYPPPTIDNHGYYKYFSYCFHPNENGYKWIGDQIVKGIKENHPKWYSEVPNPNIEWEWDGNDIKFYKQPNLF